MSRLPREQFIALAWVAAALAGGVLLSVDRVPIWATAAASLCISWRLAVAMGIAPMPARLLRILLTFALLALVYTRFQTLNGLHAGTALLVVMGSIKLLETNSRRDRGIVVGTALFLLLAATLDRQNLLRVPLYLAHTWLCCTALAFNAHDGRGFSTRAALALAGRSLLFAIPLACMLFLFFPRVSGSFWSLPQSSDAATGLGETMSPGSISSLTESDDPAFRVRFEGTPPPPQERYWRGPVLRDFDGYTWSRLPGHYHREQKLEYLGGRYAYHITMEPHSKQWWFALDIVRGSPSRKVIFTADYQLLAMDPVTRQTSYDAVSYTHTRSLDTLSGLARRYNSALPPDRNPRSAELARMIRNTATTDMAYVGAMLEYFRSSGFEYTLTPPRLDYDSVDDLLFNTRKGFCGHYASAFVNLMRAAGVPARIVTGYLGGEWNPIGGFFVVRQSDAHAWAEVWIDGRGWIRVDPTAVIAPERLRRDIYDLLPDSISTPQRLMRDFAWLARTRHNWEALNVWWQEDVIRFDLKKQLRLLRHLGIDYPQWQHLGWVLSIGLVLWLGWVTWVIGRRARPAPPDALARAYEQLCQKLARAGLPRAPHLGPIAYAGAIAEERPDIADRARPLLEQYADLRYGTADNVASFKRAVERLRTPKGVQPLPDPWRAALEKNVPLYTRMPRELRLRLEPLMRAFLKRVTFVGCNGLAVTDEMRVTIAMQACLLVVRQRGFAYDELRSVLVYPDEFLVTESEVDEAGVVTEGTRALSGQTFDTSRIVLSWSDVQQSGSGDEAYNVVLHEFAHYLDHSMGGALTEGPASSKHEAFAKWHAVLEREYDDLCAAVERDEETLIDPYGAEHPAEFFAVATETFFEQPKKMRQLHPHLYDELSRFYGLDPAKWPMRAESAAPHRLQV